MMNLSKIQSQCQSNSSKTHQPLNNSGSSITEILGQLYHMNEQVKRKQYDAIKMRSEMLKKQSEYKQNLNQKQNIINQLKNTVNNYENTIKRMKEQNNKMKKVLEQYSTEQKNDDQYNTPRVLISTLEYVKIITRRAPNLIKTKQDFPNQQYEHELQKKQSKNTTPAKQCLIALLQSELNQLKQQNVSLRSIINNQRHRYESLLGDKGRLDDKSVQIEKIITERNLINEINRTLKNALIVSEKQLEQMKTQNQQQRLQILKQLQSLEIRQQKIKTELSEKIQTLQQLKQQHIKLKKYHKQKMDELKKAQQIQFNIEELQILKSQLKQAKALIGQQANTIRQYKDKYEQQLQNHEQFEKLYEETIIELDKSNGKIQYLQSCQQTIKEQYKNKQKQMYSSMDQIINNKNYIAQQLMDRQDKLKKVNKQNQQLSIRLAQLNGTFSSRNTINTIPSPRNFNNNGSVPNYMNQRGQNYQNRPPNLLRMQ